MANRMLKETQKQGQAFQNKFKHVPSKRRFLNWDPAQIIDSDTTGFDFDFDPTKIIKSTSRIQEALQTKE